jgi:biotin carboxylase
LIELAYGFNVYGSIIKCLAGEILSIPQQPTRGACIRYFEPHPGTLKEIHGTDILNQQNPYIIDWSITAKLGTKIAPLTSSWSRVGYVLVTGNNNYDAYQKAEGLVQKIEFVIV